MLTNVLSHPSSCFKSTQTMTDQPSDGLAMQPQAQHFADEYDNQAQGEELAAHRITTPWTAIMDMINIPACLGGN